MGLSTGRLNRRITIIRPVLTDDGHGSQVQTFEPVATVWAEALSQNGREAVIAGALQGISAMRVTMRYRSDVDTSCQISIDGKDYNARSVEDPNGRREQLVILADTESTVSGAA